MSQFRSMCCIRSEPQEKEFNTKITEKRAQSQREERLVEFATQEQRPACRLPAVAGRPLLHNQVIGRQKSFLLDEELARGVPIHRLEADFVAWAQLPRLLMSGRLRWRFGVTAGGFAAPQIK